MAILGQEIWIKINPIIKLWIPKCFKEDKKLTNDKVE